MITGSSWPGAATTPSRSPKHCTHDEAAALMVEDWNHSARRLYRDLGTRYRAVAAAVP